MVFRLLREFGDEKMTCSKLQVFTNKQWHMLDKPAFECDANEEKYRDYSEKFPKCSDFCLPEGTYPVKLKPTVYSGMTISVTHCPGHNSTQIVAIPSTVKVSHGYVLIGERDEECEFPEDWHDSYLENSKEVFAKLNDLVYKHALLEANKIVISNINIRKK